MTHGRYGYSIEDGQLGLNIASTGVPKKNRSLTGSNGALIKALSELNNRLEKLEARLDEFRMIISQEFFQSPLSKPEALEKIPKDILMSWPRDMRERVAPERFCIGDGPYSKTS